MIRLTFYPEDKYFRDNVTELIADKLTVKVMFISKPGFVEGVITDLPRHGFIFVGETKVAMSDIYNVSTKGRLTQS